MTKLSGLLVSAIQRGGVPVTAAFGPVIGGFLVNPAAAEDQELPAAEDIYVDITGPAALGETETTVAVPPGGLFQIPAGITTNVSVNAASAGHAFGGILFVSSVQYPPTPQTGTFPPSSPTSITAIIPSYLYREYADDDSMQDYVGAYNALAQGYLNWFNGTPLPVYTDQAISGALLDWVAEGLYGMVRPTLSSGQSNVVGPPNTFAPNTIAPNVRKLVSQGNVAATSDDVFKRIITWNFYKGDGNTFNIRWLKRRVMRFLTGANGTAPNVDYTYPVSVTVGPGIIAIAINTGTRMYTGGAIPNRFAPNRFAPNASTSRYMGGGAPLPLQDVFREAMLSGALTMPFQYDVAVSIGGG